MCLSGTLERARARVARGRRAGGSTHLDVYVRCTVVVYTGLTHTRAQYEGRVKYRGNIQQYTSEYYFIYI